MVRRSGQYWWDRPQEKRPVPINEVTASWEQRTMTDVRLDAYNEGRTVNAFGFPE